MSTPPASPLLSPSQLEALAEIGEERSAAAGDLLYKVGDPTYPFVAVLEGEVAIVDAAGNELVRHGPSGFLGELNLLSGQTVFVNAVVKEPLRYIAVERTALRSLLDDDGPLSDLLLSTFIAHAHPAVATPAALVDEFVRVDQAVVTAGVVGCQAPHPEDHIVLALEERVGRKWLDALVFEPAIRRGKHEVGRHAREPYAFIDRGAAHR